MEWRLLTLFVKEINRTRGMTATHPSTHSRLHVSGWNGFHSLPLQKREKERESKVMPSTHSLPLYMKVDGMASTHSLYKRSEREGVQEKIHSLYKRRSKESESKVMPSTHSLPLICKWMEWHPLTLFIKDEEGVQGQWATSY